MAEEREEELTIDDLARGIMQNRRIITTSDPIAALRADLDAQLTNIRGVQAQLDKRVSKLEEVVEKLTSGEEESIEETEF